MNHWMQRKLYECPACHAKYLHDRAHEHAVYLCPLRHEPVARAPHLSSNVLGYSQQAA